jgi:hypothetical protein
MNRPICILHKPYKSNPFNLDFSKILDALVNIRASMGCKSSGWAEEMLLHISLPQAACVELIRLCDIESA